MNVESLVNMCAELGIKLALKGDDNDRLQVDAPKGAMTVGLRKSLVDQKADLIAFLKTKQPVSGQVKPSVSSEDPDETVTRAPGGKS